MELLLSKKDTSTNGRNKNTGWFNGRTNSMRNFLWIHSRI